MRTNNYQAAVHILETVDARCHANKLDLVGCLRGVKHLFLIPSPSSPQGRIKGVR